eukprot:c8480_g1_i1 orf=204-518(+)
MLKSPITTYLSPSMRLANLSQSSILSLLVFGAYTLTRTTFRLATSSLTHMNDPFTSFPQSSINHILVTNRANPPLVPSASTQQTSWFLDRKLRPFTTPALSFVS